MIKESISSAFRAVNPNYASFLSGIMATIAIEIYMQVVLSNSLKWYFGIVSGSLILLSSVLLTGLSLSLQDILNIATAKAPSTFGPEDKKVIHLELIMTSFRPLASSFFLSILLAGCGLVALELARM